MLSTFLLRQAKTNPAGAGPARISRKGTGKRRAVRRLCLEPLEDRCCPSTDLLVSGFLSNNVLRYDGNTGAFVDTFIPAGTGGLTNPDGLVYGPDGNLYVSSVGTDSVLRYDGNTGAFLDAFVPSGSGGLITPHALAFGPDGNLYVSSRDGHDVHRYNGTTGAFIDEFVPAGSGGLTAAPGMTFGPDNNLYVSSRDASSVLRYDGTTGAFLGAFVLPRSGGLLSTEGLLFANDGSSLYVTSASTSQILRYDGQTGAFLGVFASGGGMGSPRSQLFGPDGNLYVTSTSNNSVARYDGQTGAFLDTFVSPGSGGLNHPTYVQFHDFAAHHLVFSQGPSDTVAGQSISPPVTVAIVDPSGNVVTGDNTDVVTLTLGNNPGGGTLHGTVSLTVVGGVAAFPDLSLDKAGSGYTLVATSSGATAAASSGFAVTPAAADHLVFLQQPTDTGAGQPIGSVIVAIVDPFGNVVTGDNTDAVTITLGNNPGGGTLSGTLTLTVSNGRAEFDDLSIDLAGAGYTLHALTDGLTAADSDAFNVTL
jgi:streptogramin lyase